MRRTRLRSIGRKKAEKTDRSFGPADRREWLHSLPCMAKGIPGHQCGPWNMDLGRFHIQAVHVLARGMGGAKGGADDQVPGCWVLHDEIGERGTPQRRKWEARTGVSLDDEAARYAALWQDFCGSGPDGGVLALVHDHDMPF